MLKLIYLKCVAKDLSSWVRGGGKQVSEWFESHSGHINRVLPPLYKHPVKVIRISRSTCDWFSSLFWNRRRVVSIYNSHSIRTNYQSIIQSDVTTLATPSLDTLITKLMHSFKLSQRSQPSTQHMQAVWCHMLRTNEGLGHIFWTPCTCCFLEYGRVARIVKLIFAPTSSINKTISRKLSLIYRRKYECPL